MLKSIRIKNQKGQQILAAANPHPEKTDSTRLAETNKKTKGLHVQDMGMMWVTKAG